MSDTDFWTRFWATICDFEDLLKVAAAIPLFFIIVQLLVITAVPRDSSSFVIMVANFVILVPLLGFFLYLVRRCKNREPEDQF